MINERNMEIVQVAIFPYETEANAFLRTRPADLVREIRWTKRGVVVVYVLRPGEEGAEAFSVKESEVQNG